MQMNSITGREESDQFRQEVYEHIDNLIEYLNDNREKIAEMILAAPCTDYTITCEWEAPDSEPLIKMQIGHLLMVGGRNGLI